MAKCYRELHLYDDAEECYVAISQYDEAKRSALIELAKMFEDATMLDRANPYISEIIEIDRQELLNPKNGEIVLTPSMEDPSTHSLGSRATSNMLEPTAPPKSTKKAIREVREMTRYEDLRVSFLQMQFLKPEVDTGNEMSKREWMRLANTLIEDFRKRKLFFPQDKSVKFFGYSKGTILRSITSNTAQAGERINTLARKLQRSTSMCYRSEWIIS